MTAPVTFYADRSTEIAEDEAGRFWVYVEGGEAVTPPREISAEEARRIAAEERGEGERWGFFVRFAALKTTAPAAAASASGAGRAGARR